MTPREFPEANTWMRPPPDLDESQCATIPAFVGVVQGGNLDGSHVAIVAWQPSPEELAELNAGSPIFLICMGGLPPHALATKFPHA